MKPEGQASTRVSLRTWLLISHLVVLAVPTIFLFVTGMLRHELIRQAGFELRRTAPMIAHWIELRASLQTGDEIDVDAAASAIMPLIRPEDDAPSGVYTWVYDLDGLLVATTAGSEPPPTLAGLKEAFEDRSDARLVSEPDPAWTDSWFAWFFEVDRLVVTRPIRVRGDVCGAVVVARSPLDPGMMLNRYTWPLRSFALFVLAVTLLMAYSTADRLGASLSRIADCRAKDCEGRSRTLSTASSRCLSRRRVP